MSKYLLFLLVGVIIISGCSLVDVTGPRELNQLTNSTDKQPSVILKVSAGYTGGPGEMPVIDPATGEIKFLNDLPVYFDPGEVDDLKKKLPDCYFGKPIISVISDVALSKKEYINTALLEPERQAYYEVKILKYIEPAKVLEARPCE
jgi:hypothetical protein